MDDSLSPDALEENRRYLEHLLERYGWLVRLRPQVLADPLIRLLLPYDHRRIIRHGRLLLCLDGLSYLVRALLTDGAYEPDVVALFEQEIGLGDTVIDIGANEGFFSALAARLVGAAGTVVAVEPQSRLHDVLAVNLALNKPGRWSIRKNIVERCTGERRILSLTPLTNTGATSAVSRYRWSRNTETVETISFDDMIDDDGLGRVDFVKIDVEGNEYEVVKSMQRSLETRRIGKLFVDYHGRILKSRGLSIVEIHDWISSFGLEARLIDGGAISDETNGYVLYARGD